MTRRRILSYMCPHVLKLKQIFLNFFLQILEVLAFIGGVQVDNEKKKITIRWTAEITWFSYFFVWRTCGAELDFLVFSIKEM